MHKFMVKFFDFMKNFIQGINVLVLLAIMLIVLNWIEALIKAQWGWMDSFRPLLDEITGLGALLMGGTFASFNVNFELKYFAAVILCVAILGLCKICTSGLNIAQELYNNSVRAAKKISENNFNIDLQDQQRRRQQQYKNYRVYVSLAPKKIDKFNLMTIDVDEQKNMMNKFLIEQFGTAPEIFEQGFVYKFSNINDVDHTLEILFKVLHSEAPVNYNICLFLDEHNEQQDTEMLKKIVSLDITNKICALSNMSYRYCFLEQQKYNTSMLGVFQLENGTIEIHEFTENYII